MKLADIEARFYELVTARDSVAVTVAERGPEVRRAVEQMVAGDARLPAIARLEIYADMYFARIRDVLADEYAKTAADRGLRVLICGAGLAAALPGVVAAHTKLPVIGVPLRSSMSVLDGLDALLSIVQMPPGVPVAAVGVDNAKNAAVLAARILGKG